VTADGGLAPELLHWIEQSANGRIAVAERRPGGGRHEAWFVDVSGPSGLRELFLRYDRGDPGATGDPFTLHREARFFLGLQGTGVPLPEIVAVHPLEQAILSTRVAGDTWFSRLKDDETRLAVARDFMGHLATLHAVDPHRIDVPGQDPDARLPLLVQREIDTWEALYRHSGDPEPLIELGLGWLRRNLPAATGPVVVVQGDTGPGNFLYADGRVTAVLDWELAHLGDPHDDLGWLALRAVQEPFTDLADRLADYSKASGREVDLDRLRYYRVFAELRVVVLGNRRDEEVDLLGEVGNALVYGALHRRLLVEALAESSGVELDPPPVLAMGETSTGWLYDAALAQLRDIIVPRSTDPFVVLRSKGVARLLKYLQQVDRFGSAATDQDLADLTDLLGERPADTGEGAARLVQAVRSGSLDETRLLRYFGRQAARQTELLRPAMGVLADRHFDPLT
jgi:aminoglycoside phosphotransferase (APT) family kinase protein